MFGTFGESLPSFKQNCSAGEVGHSGLAEKIGARGYDGGTYNSPFMQSGHPKEPFWAPGKFNACMFMRPRRRRMNVVSILAAMVIPIALFTITTWLFSFVVRDKYSIWGWFFVAMSLILAIIFVVKAFIVRRKQKEEVWTVPWYLRNDDDTWFLFLGLAVIFAIALGLLFGEIIYSTSTKPYYTLSELHTYQNVDPANGGRAYLDAGAINFKPDSYVDVTRSLGYKDGPVYCVAPIKFGNDHVAKMDFWAVGIDCCNGFPGTWNCFEARHDSTAHGGIRVINDGTIPFFQVAVMQATSEFNREAPSPIFITWVADPVKKIDGYWKRGRTMFIIGAVVFALLEIGAVSFMAYTFWKNKLWG